MGAVTIKHKISPVVSPNNGSLYLTDDFIDNPFNIYDYRFKGIIENLNLSENASDASKFSLELCNPDLQTGERWIPVEVGKFRDKTLIFSLNLAKIFNKGFLGKSKYRLSYVNKGEEKRIISGSSGPDVLVNFMNERVYLNEEQQLSASVDVRSSMNGVKVDLKCNCHADPRGWTVIGEPKYYVSNNKEMKTLVWEDVQCNDTCELEFFVDTKSLMQPSYKGSFIPINGESKPKLFNIAD